MKRVFTGVLFVGAAIATVSCGQHQERASADATEVSAPEMPQPTVFEGEKHLANLRMLTNGGQNAEAYWNYAGTELIFQSTRDSLNCDQIFRMNGDGSNVRMVSNGNGATTCSFIAPDGSHIIYSSTHEAGEECPPKADMSRGYTWPLYDGYEIYRADPDGSNIVNISNSPRYDAEAVYSPKGDKIVFTSLRTGDLELFLMDPDGSNVEQLTDDVGYDGGAFFSYDGEWIVWRASRPEGEVLADYQALLADDLIRPNRLNIYIMNLTDREPIQLTDNEAANFGPYWHPDGQRIIFVSNLHEEGGRNFDLFLIDKDSREITQVTHNETFDGFPMFSHDGTKLVFASNRNNAVQGETNIFVADWVD